MTSLRRPRLMVAVLAASVLMSLAATSVDASLPRARPYHVHGAFTLDTNLLSKSGLSAWAIDAYLRAHTSLPPLGSAFLAAERRYGVNARFLLAAAMHESGWGSSAIARIKHNLFGYNAYDRNPFLYATAHATYAANINATAKFIRNAYLKPGGRWWGGQPTLRSMQQYWSSSGQWGINVSQIASSIQLDGFRGRAIKVATPVVHGNLHTGDRATVRLEWAGGTIPSGVTFVATWEPVEPSTDAPPGPAAAPGTDGTAAAGVGPNGAPSATSSPAAASPQAAPVESAPKPVPAQRTRTGSRFVTLTVAAPKQPGSYRLSVDMRDVDRRPLPAYQRLRIPSVEVRIWDDRAVSVALEPGPTGLGAVLRITNTGRQTIPATPQHQPSAANVPDTQADRTLVTVTATADDLLNPNPVSLLVAPLTDDLRPGDSVSFDLPAVDAATGRSTNWLSVGLSVLGDPTWLGASSVLGAWASGSGTGTATVVAFSTTVPAQAVDPQDWGQSPATPAPSATAVSSTRSATSTAPTPKHVKRYFSEHSSRIVYRGSWATAASSSYIGGYVRYSTTAGSTARFTFTGSSVRWIGPRGPTRGAAFVLIDGRVVARVDLWSSSFVARSVLFSHTFRESGKHTLTIKVLSMPGRPYVAIDQLDIRT